MGYSILTPQSSFVRFDGEAPENHCIHGQFNQCLPVYAEDDVAFQFVVEADTEAEANALCAVYTSGIQIGLVSTCDQEGFDVEFEEAPERYRISTLQVLFNWPHGLPGMLGFYNTGDCFYIRVAVGDTTDCSNCFQRIPDDCFTSVIEYGNDENFGGFNYCNSEGIDSDDTTCDKTVIEFVNKETLVVPYTAGLQSMYGQVPSVQVWIYDPGGNLVNMSTAVTFDAMPPTQINFDFGGLASGIIVIR